MMTDKKVFEIHKNEDEAAVHLAQLKEGLPQIAQLLAVKAEMCRNYYNALISQGFTEQQALEICSKMTLSSL